MFTVMHNTLTPAEYADLYASVGWTPPPLEQIAIALAHSDLTVSVWDNGTLIAMGRIIGDHAISFFVKDIAVRPDYQGRGAGKLIMDTMIAFIRETVPQGYNVSMELIASEGKEGFYGPFGFGAKPGDGMGHGMMALVVGQKPVGGSPRRK